MYRSIQSTDTYAKNLGTTVSSMNAAVSAATTATAALSGQLAALNVSVAALPSAISAVNASFSNRLDSLGSTVASMNAALSGQLAAVNTTASSVAVAFNALPAPIRDGSLVATVAAVNASIQSVAGSVVAVGATVAAVNASVPTLLGTLNASISSRMDTTAVSVSSLQSVTADFSVRLASFNGTVGSLASDMALLRNALNDTVQSLPFRRRFTSGLLTFPDLSGGALTIEHNLSVVPAIVVVTIQLLPGHGCSGFSDGDTSMVFPASTYYVGSATLPGSLIVHSPTVSQLELRMIGQPKVLTGGVQCFPSVSQFAVRVLCAG